MSLYEEEKERLFRNYIKRSQARIKNPLTLEQKIEWIKNHPGTTARACRVSVQEVLNNPEKYARKLAY